MVEDARIPLDLGSTDLRAFAKSREIIVVELKVSEGDLFADATKRVRVDDDEPGVLRLTGRRSAGAVPMFLD